MNKTKLWIADEWVTADRQVVLSNPHTGEVLADIGYASPAQAERAIEAAATAFTTFCDLPIHERSAILRRVADIFEAKLEEAARLVAMEAGKPMKAARGEIHRTIETYRFSAEAAKNLYGETIPMDAAPNGENHVAYVTRQPLGVVSAITPFNFPMNLVAHKVGPAIAAGNTIVLKPAEQTPLSALFLAETFQAAGLPRGVLNVIPGSGKELSEVLTTHPKVAFITFTGSPTVGKLIRAQAGLRKVTLELGSNSPVLVDEGFSPANLDSIADEVVAGGFSYNGQVCISVQRVYVQQSAYEAFVERVVAQATRLKIGNPLDDDTDVSALINDAAVDKLKTWLKHAVDGGATVHCGGTFEGNVLHPTVLTNVPKDTELNCEEAFGPIVSISPFENWDEAIAMANDSKFGLNAGAFTKDMQRAFTAVKKLQAGGVLINQTPTFRVDHMPYGGIKDSGVGREGVRYAMEDMMDLKLASFRLGVYDA